MLRTVVTLHLLFIIAFTVFMLEYYETLYPESILCDKVVGCLYRLDNSSSLLPCSNLSYILSCRGHEFCCKLCEKRSKKMDGQSVTAVNNIFNITTTTCSTLGILFLFYLLSIYLAYKKKYQLLTGFLIFLILGSMLVLVLFLGISVVVDFPYYKSCNSEFAINLGWLMVTSFIFLDLLLSFSSADKLIDEEAPVRTILTKPIHVILDCIFRIALIWWPLLVIYFIGIGNKRWNPLT